MNVFTASCTGPLLLGRQGENGVVTIRFPIREWPESGGGQRHFALLHQRAQDEAAYPCTVTDDGQYVYWPVTAADTQYDGRGQAELTCTVGDTVAKSEIFSTVVAPALDGSGEAPQPWQAWVDEVLSAAAAVDEAAAHYPKIGAGGTWLVWDAENGAWEDTGVAASSAEGGTGDHRQLTHRDAADQHPMSAITGLASALDTLDGQKQTKSITDAGGYFTAATVEGALQEIGAELSGVHTLLGSGVIA